MKKILNKLPIISICLVFCLTLLLGVFLTLPQTKDVYADTINWLQKDPGLYDDYGGLIANWETVKSSYFDWGGEYTGDTPGNLVVGSVSFETYVEYKTITNMFRGCSSLKTITFKDTFDTSEITEMCNVFRGDFNTIDIRPFDFGSIDYDCDSYCQIFGVLSDDDLENEFELIYELAEPYEECVSLGQGFKDKNMTYKEKLCWLENFYVEYNLKDYYNNYYGFDWPEWDEHNSTFDGIIQYYDCIDDYTNNVEFKSFASYRKGWLLEFTGGNVQTIIAPATVPENKILLPEPYYFAIFDEYGNLTYKGETYNVMGSYETMFPDDDPLPEGYGCAYLLNPAKENVYSNFSHVDIQQINFDVSENTNTSRSVAGAKQATGNNQVQAVFPEVINVAGTSGQSVTLEVYCEQNPTTNNQIILMSNTGSGWTQASCNASYDGTNKVLTVISTMPASSSSFAVLSAPQGDSPASPPTPGTGIVTNLTLGFVISGVLAGIVTTFAITNKKKKYNNN